jgi:hypothetical protein
MLLSSVYLTGKLIENEKLHCFWGFQSLKKKGIIIIIINVIFVVFIYLLTLLYTI